MPIETTSAKLDRHLMMGSRTGLIIGISGQDGSYLAQHLLSKDYTVIGTTRQPPRSTFPNLEILGIQDRLRLETIDLTDLEDVTDLLTRVAPDEIYHLAGQSSVALSFEQPIATFESITISTLNLLESARRCGSKARFYNACSSECFGNTAGTPATETTLFHPRSPYAVAKAAAFWQVASYREAYDLYCCSGLLFNHDSPLRPTRFVTSKIVRTACRIHAGSPEKLRLGNIGIQRDWGWAPEYVDAMWRMLQLDEPEDFVIATGQSYSLETFVDTVFSLLDMDWRDHVEISGHIVRPADIEVSLANPSKAEDKLGWRAAYTMRDVAHMMISAESEKLT